MNNQNYFDVNSNHFHAETGSRSKSKLNGENDDGTSSNSNSSNSIKKQQGHRISVLNSVNNDFVNKYEKKIQSQESGDDSKILWESNPFCIPEELDDLLFDDDDYKNHGMMLTIILTKLFIVNV